MLPTEAIKEFIEIHKKSTGVILSLKEATILAQRLFDGMQLLFTQKDIVASSNN